MKFDPQRNTQNNNSRLCSRIIIVATAPHEIEIIFVTTSENP